MALPALGALLVVALLAAGPAPAGAADASGPGVLDPGLSTTGQALQPVVVTGPGGPDALARAVDRAGGDVGALLPLVGGLAARVPASALAELAAAPGVSAVTADRTGVVSGRSYDDRVSASTFAWSSGASELWSRTRGAGVGVAVLDTGVSPVADLAGRLVHGPDLSGEGAPQKDSFGHGTVMAGLVAGSGVQAGKKPRTGVAPGATVVSVKVAGEDGSTDVSTVLAAMHWVHSFRETYGIRVLNLSWGVPSTQDPQVDPLNHAVQRLWQDGITVVVAAGNTGPTTGSVLKPADDPLVVTVGAYDDGGTVKPGDDSVPSWSSRGPTAQGLVKPDLVAPGRSLVAVRAAGSRIEQENEKAHVKDGYIRGSGTSQAAAVVSGAAALLLADRPELTPDQVKAALVGSAVPLPGVPSVQQGAGRLQVPSASVAAVADVPSATPTATGTGSLDASRGASPRVQTTCGGETVVLDDETAAWCAPWDATSWTATSWTATSWTSAGWDGSTWTGSPWSATSWTATSWTATSWTATSWTATSWTATSWTATSWTATSWTSSGYEGQDGFQGAFWGDQPRWWQHLPGEESEPVPPGCRRHDTCAP